MAEITISGSGSRGNNGNTLRQNRHFQLFIQCQYTFLFQLQQYFPSAAGHVSQCIGRVNIKHCQTVAVKFVKLNRHFYQHFDAGSKHLSGSFLEIGFQQTVDIVPNHTTRLSDKVVAARIFLYKFQITMSGRIGTDIAQLCLYPVFIWQTLLQTAADKRIQF